METKHLWLRAMSGLAMLSGYDCRMCGLLEERLFALMFHQVHKQTSVTCSDLLNGREGMGGGGGGKRGEKVGRGEREKKLSFLGYLVVKMNIVHTSHLIC